MSTFLIESDGRPLVQVQNQLKKHLKGLDARLFALSERRALLRGHLLQALATEYSSPRSVWLSVLGIEKCLPLTDEQVLGMLQGRDLPELPALRSNVSQSQANGLDWHLDVVNVAPAWNMLGGPDNIPWGDTKVAHLDTGYTRHPALGFNGATWIDVAHARTDKPDPPKYFNGDFTEPGSGQDPLEQEGISRGHGTRMAGTICGWAPDAPGGAFFGVAPKVPLLPVRVTDVVWANHAQREMARALDFACQTDGVKVVNISLGVFGATVRPELRKALNRAYEQGLIVVCAAGNHIDPVVAPARLSRTFAVAGVTQEGRPWCGSSFGAEVDISAPAADLRRATVDKSYRYTYAWGGDGTSYATAMTSGAAALWLTYHAGRLNQQYTQPWCVVEAFSKLARETAKLPAGVVWKVDGGFGRGVLDIGALLQAPLPAQTALTMADAI